LSYASRGQKGGTLIDESVVDLAEHEARMRDPASYRPKECRCGGWTLHVHGRRERRMVGSAVADGGLGTVTVMVFLCVSCLATWRVLPAFLTRCLWRAWAVVEGVVAGTRRSDEPPVPGRTQRRWRGRLAQTARVPGQVLATSGSAALRGVVQGLGLDGDRRALASGYAARFRTSLVAGLVGRGLVPRRARTIFRIVRHLLARVSERPPSYAAAG
jgi:hypothetical protein